MKQRPRIYYTEAQKAMMWDRWSKGDTLHQIGKLFGLSRERVRQIEREVMSKLRDGERAEKLREYATYFFLPHLAGLPYF